MPIKPFEDNVLCQSSEKGPNPTHVLYSDQVLPPTDPDVRASRLHTRALLIDFDLAEGRGA
jgi:hypothetical protein